ncbi:acyltransferase family protein [Clostridium massiliamazoniense]|uniref:acyltransferase family protein n=1 Tax=Clostridium massiliamazoniense TaxID=1347366 RepID=UPI0006D7DF3E|nr:acyltransferase [Clostridium massiliamazoniense]
MQSFTKSFNIMKLILAVGVIYQHTVGWLLESDKANGFTTLVFGTIFNFTRIAVPSFMIISGFLMMMNYKNLSIKDFYKNKLTKILIVYISSVVIFSPTKIFTGKYSISLFINDILFGSSFSHLWYLNTLIRFYLLFPLFLWLVKFICKNKQWIVILILLGIIHFIIISQIHNLESVLPSLYYKYRDRSLIIWLYYFILGGVISEKADWTAMMLIKFRNIIYIFTGGYFIFYNSIILNNHWKGGAVNYLIGAPNSKINFIYNIIGFFSLWLFVEYKYNKISFLEEKYFKFNLELYISHPIAIGIANVILYISSFYINYNIYIVLLFLLTCIISLKLKEYYNKLITVPMNKIFIRNKEREKILT